MTPNIRKSILATLLLLGYTESRLKSTRLIDVVATILPNPGHFHSLMAVSLNFIVLTASFAAYKIYGATIESKWTEPTYLSHSFFTGASAIFRWYAMYAYIGFRKFIVNVNGKQSWLSHPAFIAFLVSFSGNTFARWFLEVTISETRKPQWFRINRIYGFWSVRECSVPSRFVHIETVLWKFSAVRNVWTLDCVCTPIVWNQNILGQNIPRNSHRICLWSSFTPVTVQTICSR